MNQKARDHLMAAARFERSAADLVEKAAKLHVKQPQTILDLAEEQRRQGAAERASAVDQGSGSVRCLDCGTDYDAAMALSLLIPKAQWLAIHPADAGVLCANCMLRRASKLPGVINITGRITFSAEYAEGCPTPYDEAEAAAARLTKP